ncbi:MAG: cytochrome b/b6 domain-containing protein [Bryobacterales bacterium]|nr:cytochrome b/b6 domain-containing protein [Bryobacterales bacterium]
MTRKLMLYPFWLRLWHWTNAGLFLVLIVSGLAMHYSTPANTLLPFQTSRLLHNTAGIALSFTYLYFVLGNLLSPNGKQYVPNRRELTEGMVKQLRFYLVGIFRGDPHPHRHSAIYKFNPLQKLTYLGIMYFAAPLVIVTGLVLLFPGMIPARLLNMTGILPVAILHSAAGFFVSLFLVGHIYLASTGDTVTENYRAMITGYHILEHHDPEELADEPDEDFTATTPTTTEESHDEALEPPRT